MSGKYILAAALCLCASTSAAAQDSPDPGLEFVYEATVTLGEVVEVGETARGTRRIIPITGGTFEGPDMRGEILPMGWDWQLDRADGCTDVVADYFLRTDDGVVINVVNTGTICPPSEGGPLLVRTSPVFETPLGKYEYLGQGGFIGTLGLAMGAEGPAVRIVVYRAN